jgi:integrase
MEKYATSQEHPAPKPKPQKKSINLEGTVFYEKELSNYVKYLNLHGRSKSTIRVYEDATRKLLNRFYSSGIRQLSDVKPIDVYEAFEASTNRDGFRTTAKSFLRYLFKKKLNDSDLSLIVPRVPVFRPVPSIYTKTETGNLLSSIDTTTLIGKRDHAMILLALRLGLRACDILKLQTSEINYEARTIEFIQQKTSVPQRLELLPEVENALNAYLASRANPNGSDYVFLSTRSPFGRLSNTAVRSVVNKYVNMAGIEAGHRKRGGHALRSTFASELAAENIPYDVIRKILGHEGQESAKHYVRFDFEMLRKSALEAPAPVGRLAEHLQIADGGDV